MDAERCSFDAASTETEGQAIADTPAARGDIAQATNPLREALD
jgi:hypothetical protein